MLNTEPRIAVFTIAQNETLFAPIWVEHYLRQGIGPRDIYVLEHVGKYPIALPSSVVHLVLKHSPSFDNRWLNKTAKLFQQFLFQSYDIVIYSDADELLFVDAATTLSEYLRKNLTAGCMRATGYNLVHLYESEPRMNFDAKLMPQRRYVQPDPHWNKPLVSRIPLDWDLGFHEAVEAKYVLPDPLLILLHLHRCDFKYACDRHAEFQTREQSTWDRENEVGWQWFISGEEKIREWWQRELSKGGLIEIPQSWTTIV